MISYSQFIGSCLICVLQMPEISYLSHYFSTLGCQVEHTLSPNIHNDHTSTCQVGMNLGLNANPKISLSEIETEKQKSK